MSNIIIPPLNWEHRPGNPKMPWYADVFDETGYSIVYSLGEYYASRYQWTGPVRDTSDEAKADAEADFQATMKRLLKIQD